MSLLTTLQVGRTGMAAAAAGIGVVGQNVANASTEGYQRRTLQTTTADPVKRSGLWIGNGTRLGSIVRAEDSILGARALTAQGSASRYQTSSGILQAAEASFSLTDDTGIAARLSAFFESLSALTADPSDYSRRTAVISAADGLASSVGTTDAYLESCQTDIASRLEAELEEVNEILSQLAALQASISGDAQVAGQGDLLDQRSALLGSLSEKLGVTVSYGSGNSVTVFLGGHAILDGTSARTLTAGTDDDGSPTISVGADGGRVDATTSAGGTMAGLLDSWETLQDTRTDLATFVDVLATAVNTQHAAGYDADGAAGGALFTFTAGSECSSFAVDASLAADPTLLACAGASSAAASDGDNLALLAAIEDEAIFSSGTVTAERFVTSIYTTFGTAAATAASRAEAAAATSADLATLHGSLTGVVLDDEATSLIAWQAAYQASARVVSASNELLDELMRIAR